MGHQTHSGNAKVQGSSGIVHDDPHVRHDKASTGLEEAPVSKDARVSLEPNVSNNSTLSNSPRINSAAQGASTSHASNGAQHNPPGPAPGSAQYIVPLAYLRGVGANAPFMRVSPHSSGRNGLILSNDAEAATRNGPLAPEAEFPLLPPLITLYLRAHGWDHRVIEAVAIAYTCEATHVGFLNTMRYQGMPLSEASFLWYGMQAFK